MMSSTLVETVSIDYEDFNDSFLTCGTCLCIYDSAERTPKLLPCSHTVCRSCLDRIVTSQTFDIGTFRCPICRETIHTPQGGVNAFPPSFIVNKLLDLMAQQRRDVIPKCSVHSNQELLFCETCDTVFCALCLDGSTHNGRGASEHTVIPFAIAIKRMSEILLFKAHLCISNLNSAYDAVSEELRQLELTSDKTMIDVNCSFQDAMSAVEHRRQECLQLVRKIKEEKKSVLKEQLDLVQAEKDKVQHECDGLQYQVEVRYITKKISDLNEKLDTTSTLSEPRENSFLRFDYKHNDALLELAKVMNRFGRISVSTTFPALCTAKALPSCVHVRSHILISTVDYHGNPRQTGGDPIAVELMSDDGDTIDTEVRDNGDGSYDVVYVPRAHGLYAISVSIFSRPIKDSPLSIDISPHINPISKFGCRGLGKDGFVQPVQVCVGANDEVFVLDTGNCRIKVLSTAGIVQRCLSPAGLENHSATGLAVSPCGKLVVVNWRTKMVSVVSQDMGELIRQFTCLAFTEPTSVVVNSHGDIVVADAGTGRVFVFDQTGNLVTTFGSKGVKDGQFKLISALAVDGSDNILVADHRLQAFTKDGRFLCHLGPLGWGQYGGVAVDVKGGAILATRTEKCASHIQVMFPDGRAQYQLNSEDDKLKRAGGLAVLPDFQLLVADLGNDCIKKYYYK